MCSVAPITGRSSAGRCVLQYPTAPHVTRHSDEAYVCIGNSLIRTKQRLSAALWYGVVRDMYSMYVSYAGSLLRILTFANNLQEDQAERCAN